MKTHLDIEQPQCSLGWIATQRGLLPNRRSSSLTLFLGSVAAFVATQLCTLPEAFSQDRWGSTRQRDLGSSSSSPWQGSNWLDSGINSSSNEWSLGVSVENTDRGAVVRQITPNGAAARARIEIDDTIVTVEGYQVGMISGRLYDLTEELNRQADSTGAVRLLLQDHNTGRLASVRVQLDSSSQKLSGTLIATQSLPSDAIVTVSIENLTRPIWVVRNGQYSFRPGTGTVIPFEIAYDPNYVSAQDLYQVRATVTSRGRTILDTLQPAKVITRGNPSQVRLQLTPTQAFANNSSASNGSGNVVTAGYPNYNAFDDQVTMLFRKYLRRDPNVIELAALRQSTDLQSTLASLPITLMANQEYFDLAGNNNPLWLENVFNVIVQRQPSPTELTQWMKRYADLRYSRTQILNELYQQSRR